ncbi:MAG: molybdopterin-dependent oxidoreductase [Candidatus Odinarchaeota archaeon]|nr:molybdopterin-dependent oxidoreductase [Candidatus Odinarchaeota archaeon]
MLPEAVLKEEKKELAFVGKKIPRVDAKEKVSGRPIYVRDLAPKVCYHAKIVRSIRPHARIKNIDVSEVLKIPGVIDVITADDIPGTNFVDAIIPDKPFLAKDEVNYVGEEIAIVVAIDKETAELAAKKVKVEYEDLPFEIDFDIDKIEPNRIICDSRIEKGDVEKGFKEAAYVIEETFETGAQEHAYIEPQGVFADASGDIIEVKAATQCPYYVQKKM